MFYWLYTFHEALTYLTEDAKTLKSYASKHRALGQYVQAFVETCVLLAIQGNIVGDCFPPLI